MHRYIYARARPEPENVASLGRHTYRDLAGYIGYMYCMYNILQRAEHLLCVSLRNEGQNMSPTLSVRFSIDGYNLQS